MNGKLKFKMIDIKMIDKIYFYINFLIFVFKDDF